VVNHDPGPADVKPPAEKIPTDGCGFMNGAALTLLKVRCNQDGRPTAVQGRIAGSKGLWILHPFDRDPNAPPRIWIRDSQKKIHLGVLDRAHRIFDLIAVARVSNSHQSSMQSIINLSHNGVPDPVFVSLMAQGLDDEVTKLTDWSSPTSSWALWKAIHQAGGVAGMRMSRHALGVTRAIGLSGREFGSGDDDDDPDDIGPINDSEPIVSMGRNNYSGAPLSVHESALELVQAGFSPLESKYLADKIHSILRLVIESYVKEYRISISESAEAFMVPGEIQFKICLWILRSV
jgi:RNA-dependent RNA polymerase